jgi:hypothetical protein
VTRLVDCPAVQPSVHQRRVVEWTKVRKGDFCSQISKSDLSASELRRQYRTDQIFNADSKLRERNCKPCERPGLPGHYLCFPIISVFP